MLASTSTSIAGSNWKEYPFEMRSGSVTPDAENHLELTIDRPAPLWLQLISLFPPTYHGRRNGNRTDIMEKLAAMRPGSCAFPEATTWRAGDRDHFDWRKMIGSWSTVRHIQALGVTIPPTAWGCWSPWSGVKTFTCSPFSRYSQAIRWAGRWQAGPALDPYVQEAWTRSNMSPAEPNKWGALRARGGHPAPLRCITWKSATKIPSTRPGPMMAALRNSTKRSRGNIRKSGDCNHSRDRCHARHCR